MEPQKLPPFPPLIMGVVNVTPDSFSDGGLFLTTDRAVEHVARLVEDGADIVDIGGESSRPGSLPVSIQEELDRVMPVIDAIKGRFPVMVSIDTTKYEVAVEATAAGAKIVNDISGGSDVRIAALAKAQDLTVILMHKKGTPATMQEAPVYKNGAVLEVRDYLKDRVRAFLEVGVPRRNLWVDPGIGFGKTLDQNLDLLRHVDMLTNGDSRLVVGTSRKSFLSKIFRDEETNELVERRRAGTLASNLWAFTKGASVFRVHEVVELKRALKTWDAIQFGC